MRPDKGYDLTEKELKALEKRIYDSYKEAYDGLTDIIKEYFAKFADRDASERHGWTLAISPRNNTSNGGLRRSGVESALRRYGIRSQSA